MITNYLPTMFYVMVITYTNVYKVLCSWPWCIHERTWL